MGPGWLWEIPKELSEADIFYLKWMGTWNKWKGTTPGQNLWRKNILEGSQPDSLGLLSVRALILCAVRFVAQ